MNRQEFSREKRHIPIKEKESIEVISLRLKNLIHYTISPKPIDYKDK